MFRTFFRFRFVVELHKHRIWAISIQNLRRGVLLMVVIVLVLIHEPYPKQHKQQLLILSMS